MKLQSIFDQTDFVHASGTKEELQVANYLKEQCETLGVPAKLEGFRVAMGEIEEAHLYADGMEISCKALTCCGSGSVEGELYYMPGTDPVSVAGAKDKIVLMDTQGIGFFAYQDLMKAGAKAILFQYGNSYYPHTDIDQRDLREAVVGEEKKVLCAMIHSAQAVELVKNKVKQIRLEIRQKEYDGESHNVIAELPGKREEWIVLSAHYDTTSLSHGAYDNMSGCAGLLGIMEQMKGKELNYGLRFVFCGSEENLSPVYRQKKSLPITSAIWLQKLDFQLRQKTASIPVIPHHLLIMGFRLFRLRVLPTEMSPRFTAATMSKM